MLTPMETPRLLLRRPRLSDADDLFSILSDAETCRMDGNYPPYSQKNEAFYADVRALADDGDNRLFLEERSTGRMVGLLHVMPADGPDACEIGFVVAPDARRRGYALESLRALLNQLSDSGMKRVLATCYRANGASAALLLRLGFAPLPDDPGETADAFSQRAFSLSLPQKLPCRKRLFLIGGPMGVGKTTAAKQLQALLERCAFLDGDWCWDLHPFRVTEETKAMVMDNIIHLLSGFLRCSEVDHVVFCWVMHEQAILDTLLSHLPLGDTDVTAVSLVCSPEALKARIDRDVQAGLRAPDVLARSLDRLPLYDTLATVKLDTTGLTPHQTAQAILTLSTEKDKEE